MMYTVNLKVTTNGYVIAEPYTVRAGNAKAAEALATAQAMDRHGQRNVTEIQVISVAEVKSRETA